MKAANKPSTNATIHIAAAFSSSGLLIVFSSKLKEKGPDKYRYLPGPH
jgi:spore maturation protein SpmB|tara:strand:- start:313 stop:456 length:144 start_codon:yes stop_codon:yes gene_type:complete